MYITFDYKCPQHGIVSRFVKKTEMDEQYCDVPHPGNPEPMLRLPAGTRTTFRFADTKLKE